MVWQGAKTYTTLTSYSNTSLLWLHNICKWSVKIFRTGVSAFAKSWRRYIPYHQCNHFRRCNHFHTLSLPCLLPSQCIISAVFTAHNQALSWLTAWAILKQFVTVQQYNATIAKGSCVWSKLTEKYSHIANKMLIVGISHWRTVKSSKWSSMNHTNSIRQCQKDWLIRGRVLF